MAPRIDEVESGIVWQWAILVVSRIVLSRSAHDEARRSPCALARVESLCARLFDHPVHIVVLSDLAVDEGFGEVSILTSDPDVELVEPSADVERTAEHG